MVMVAVLRRMQLGDKSEQPDSHHEQQLKDMHPIEAGRDGDYGTRRRTS